MFRLLPFSISAFYLAAESKQPAYICRHVVGKLGSGADRLMHGPGNQFPDVGELPVLELQQTGDRDPAIGRGWQQQ